MHMYIFYKYVVCVPQLNGLSQMKYSYKTFGLVRSQQKGSTISSASTTTATAVTIRHNFVKLGNTQPPWRFGLAFHSAIVLSMVLGSPSQ